MNTRPNQSREILPPDETAFEPAGGFAADLRNLRTAVHCAAERKTAQPVPANWLAPAKLRRRAGQRRLVLAWSCAALLCISALPFLHHTKPVVVRPAIAHVQTDVDDTALLEQVDTAVSESVPSSLAPLDSLDSWSSTDSNEITTEPSLNKPEKKNVAR